MAHDASPWTVKVAATALRSSNPIRKIVDGIKKPVMPEKPIIPLSLGDPTLFGNFTAPDVLTRALHGLIE